MSAAAMATNTVALPRTLDEFAAQLKLLEFDECPICMDPYHEDHVAAQLPKCKHVIGQPCLLKWLHGGMEGSHKCPICRTVLYQIYDDEGEEAHVGFIQRLWAALYELHLRTIANPDGSVSASDAISEQIFNQLGYQRIRWPDHEDHREALTLLVLTSHVMLHAMSIDSCPSSPAIDEYTAELWYDGITSLPRAKKFTWRELSLGVEELRFEEIPDDNYSRHLQRRQLVYWFTMRLMQDLSKHCDSAIWPLEDADASISIRVLAIGAMLKGNITTEFLRHTVQVAKILHRFHYPSLALPGHEETLFYDGDLRWLWLHPNELSSLYCSAIPAMRLDSTTEDRAMTQSLAITQITGCFLQCWDEIWRTLASNPDFELTDTFLLGVLTNKAAVFDLWSFLNLATQGYWSNRLLLHYRIYRASQTGLRLISRIITREMSGYKQVGTNENNGRSANSVVTKPMFDTRAIEPFLEFLFRAVQRNEDNDNEQNVNLDWMTLSSITKPPETPFHRALEWLLAILLCREVERRRQQGHFLGNIRESVIQLVNTWQGYAESEPEPEVVDRMMWFVEYVARRQKPGELLVSGQDDRRKALGMWAKSKAFKIWWGYWKSLRVWLAIGAIILLAPLGYMAFVDVSHRISRPNV